MEKKRGISITNLGDAVPHADCLVNLLDTLGHEDSPKIPTVPHQPWIAA